jgi:predicted DCC family thiol-disulfide oxidoreductase YuxK
MKKLYILYDAQCGLCTWARQWMLRQPGFLALEFVPAGSATSASKFPGLEKLGKPEELIVIDDTGGIYRDGDAWVMCLYALREYREWSLRLARPALLPLARSAFQLLSKNRLALSRFLDLRTDEPLQHRLELAPSPACGQKGVRP